MTYQERMELERLLKDGKSIKEVAKAMDYTYSGIYYELRRMNMNSGNYNAKKAQLCVGDTNV